MAKWGVFDESGQQKIMKANGLIFVLTGENIN